VKDANPPFCFFVLRSRRSFSSAVCSGEVFPEEVFSDRLSDIVPLNYLLPFVRVDFDFRIPLNLGSLLLCGLDQPYVIALAKEIYVVVSLVCGHL
jgi:hypothetical protein